MLRKLPLLRYLSRLGLINKNGRRHLIMLSKSSLAGVKSLQDMGCVFDGGYVFLPPAGEIVGMYSEVVLLGWCDKGKKERGKSKDE